MNYDLFFPVVSSLSLYFLSIALNLSHFSNNSILMSAGQSTVSKKRQIYDRYGMNANEQANADINVDQYGSLASVLGAIFRGDTPTDA